MKVKPTYNDQPLEEFFHVSRGFPRAVIDIAKKLRSNTSQIPAGTYFDEFGDTTVLSVVEETDPKEIWLSIISTCLTVYGNASTAYNCQVSNLRASFDQKIAADVDRTLYDEFCEADILIVFDDRSSTADSKMAHHEQAILNKLIHKRSCSPGTITLLIGDYWNKCKPYENYKALLDLKRAIQ